MKALLKVKLRNFLLSNKRMVTIVFIIATTFGLLFCYLLYSKKALTNSTHIVNNDLTTSKQHNRLQQVIKYTKNRQNTGKNTEKDLTHLEDQNKIKNNYNVQSNNQNNNSKNAENKIIVLKAQNIKNYASKYTNIQKVVFNKKLLAGKVYKIAFGNDFNQWVIKWVLFDKNVLAQNESNLVPFDIVVSKLNKLASVSGNNQDNKNTMVKVHIHADFIDKAKGLKVNSLTNIGNTNAQLENHILTSNYLKNSNNTSTVKLISQIIYTTNKEIYIKPKKDFYLQEIELWKVKSQPNISNSSISKTSFNSASINYQNIAEVADYNTAYNLDVSSGLKFSTLNIIPRSVWGANPSQWDPIKKNLNINDVKRLKYIKSDNCRWLPEYYRPTRIVIHHTVTHNYPNDPYREIREIYIYHAYSRGWGDIGYNYLIDSSGRIFEGKIGGDGVKGYHAFESANDMSIGIALIGDFTYSNPTTAQLDALKKLLAEKSALYGINLHYTGTGSLSDWLNQNVTVFGHRHVWVWNWDNNSWKYHATACPGQKFVTSGKLQQVIQDAKNYAQNHYQNIKDARQWAINILADYINNFNIFAQVEFNDSSASRQALLAKTPKYSGIKNIYLGPDKKLHMTIGVVDNHACGWVVPPKGWHGYDSCGTNGCMYFPTYNGPYDRAVILFTLFKLNPLYKNVKVVNGNIGWVE